MLFDFQLIAQCFNITITLPNQYCIPMLQTIDDMKKKKKSWNFMHFFIINLISSDVELINPTYSAVMKTILRYCNRLLFSCKKSPIFLPGSFSCTPSSHFWMEDKSGITESLLFWCLHPRLCYTSKGMKLLMYTGLPT